MSLNEIAVDLTCEPVIFQPASTPPPPSSPDDIDDENSPMPGKFAFPTTPEKETVGEDGPPRYEVHGGMLRMAKVMGDIGKPVHLAVLEALFNNPDYGALCCLIL